MILCLVSKSGPVTVQTGELRGNVHTQVVPGHVRAPLVSQGLVMEAENVPDIDTLVLTLMSPLNTTHICLSIISAFVILIVIFIILKLVSRLSQLFKKPL